jgi:hypothetical protein
VTTEPQTQPRYKVIEESESEHCCFVATVVDTKQSTTSELTGGSSHTVCETFYSEDAQLVCDALNNYELVGDLVDVLHDVYHTDGQNIWGYVELERVKALITKAKALQPTAGNKND